MRAQGHGRNEKVGLLREQTKLIDNETKQNKAQKTKELMGMQRVHGLIEQNKEEKTNGSTEKRRLHGRAKEQGQQKMTQPMRDITQTQKQEDQEKQKKRVKRQEIKPLNA
jgi:hypothetical protein